MVDLSPYKFDGPGGEGAKAWVHKAVMPDPYRGPFRPGEPPEGPNRPSDGDSIYLPEDELGPRYAEDVEQIIARLDDSARAPAGFFCESLLGCGGQIVLPSGYMESAFRHVREAGGICVADEVQVGFGRVGSHFWGFETQGVVPDIVTLGKPMGNGHPLAAVVTTPAIASSFDTGMEYFNTYGGNPVSCAIGMAVLDVIEEEKLQENAHRVGAHLLERLGPLADRHRIVGDVRGLGLYIGVEIVADPGTRTPAPASAARLKERLRAHRILLSTDGPEDNVLKIKPPIVFTGDDAERLVDSLSRILDEDEFQL
jgi:ethanolamine-phosphate phospho-lyase